MLTRRAILRRAILAPIPALWAGAAGAQTTDPGIYFDEAKLIVQRDSDGGDTAQREGWMWSGIKLRELIGAPSWSVTAPLALPATLDLLEDGRTGRFRRHPTQPKWSDPKDYSRDQATSVVTAMGLWGDIPRLRRTWYALSACNLVFKCVQGTADLAGPDFVNLYRRGLGQDPDPNGDAFLYMGVVNRLAQTVKAPDDVGDDVNLTLQLCYAAAVAPTDTTELARNLYAKNRPVSSGCYLSHYRQRFPADYSASESLMQQRIRGGIAAGWKPDCPRVLGALRWYFRAESGGCSSLAELYEPIIDKYLI